MKIFTVVGARPQFVKASPVSRVLRGAHEEILVHTGQHYDPEMSDIFFTQMGIPTPDTNLGVGSGSHAKQTGEMLVALEGLMVEHQPDWVLVYGDTNSTLAGALAAAKLHIPIAHVEAGLRSFNRTMPEEINRVLTDHCADLLLCPTQTAVDNLTQEGVTRGVSLVGDVMYDALLAFLPRADEAGVLAKYGVAPKEYVLATLHRAANTDDPARLAQALRCLALSPYPLLLPAHPRTVAAIARHGLRLPPSLRLIPPVGYLEMLALESNSRLIMTDSGGVQKEAYLLGVPCITLRPETEWVETVASGWNVVTDLDEAGVAAALAAPPPTEPPPPHFGDGDAATKILARLEA